MPLTGETKNIKVTLEAKYKEGDILCAEGNVNYDGTIYLWFAKESHYGLGYDVEIKDNGKIPSKDIDFISAAIRTSIEENIVETTYRIKKQF
ncbi:MAG: hypothetical protein N2999_02380 [Proteobacteria bacterium]|nr:hypothetical protein [Pseudomonadota bacterium]